MKKMESSLKNMVLSLGCITVAAAALLAAVDSVTQEPIREAELQVQNKALAAVLPEHDNDPAAEKFSMLLNAGKSDSVRVMIYPARRQTQLVGAAVEAETSGFSDRIAVVYGFEEDGTVRNYSVLRQAETPGLGTKMEEWFRDPSGNRSVIGRNPGAENLAVSKDGGEIDAITAATISSRAFLKTLNDAFRAYRQLCEKEKGGKDE